MIASERRAVAGILRHVFGNKQANVREALVKKIGLIQDIRRYFKKIERLLSWLFKDKQTAQIVIQ